MKFTDEQKDLLAFLPKALKNSNELTDSSKLVLGNIIFLYGMEDAQKNGYVYRSYDDLMKDTFIKSKTSISKAIALLVQKGHIKVKRGNMEDRKANEFTILNSTLLNKMCTQKCTDENEKCTLTEYWTNKIESLENEIVLLKKEIEELKKCTEKCTDKNEKCTQKCTTDTDTEIDKDITKDISTCSNSTCMEKDNIKEKINKKESDFGDKSQMEKVNKNLKLIEMKENEMSNNVASVMNAKSEMKWNGKQRSNNVAGCVKENEMTTSLATALNETDTPSKEKVNNNPKLQIDGSIFKEDCSNTPHPQIAPNPLSPNDWDEEAIFGGSGSQETAQVDNLSTKGNTTQQEALKCPQIEFDNERMDKLLNLSQRETNLERFKDYVKQMDECMQYLKANDPHLFNMYKKEIYCWFAISTWDMDIDFIEVGGNFKRKYVA